MKKLFLLVVMVVLGSLVLVGCGKKTLVGSWKHTSGYTYNFNEDNTGYYNYGNNTTLKFTYEDKGDKVLIKYNNADNTNEFEYTIKGDTLIITDSFGNKVEYTRK